jgi:FXSXX-COOH protein
MRDTSSEITGCLVDVRELSLADLEAIDETALAQALRRVLDDEQAETVAGFQSKIEDVALLPGRS